MSIDYNKDQYNENLQSGRGRDVNNPNPNGGNFFKGIATGPEQVPRHIHDGVDSPRINYSDLTVGASNTVEIQITAGTAAQNTTTFSKLLQQANINTSGAVKNPKQVVFKGIAKTPVTGTVTSKASLTGNALLGPSYQNINAFDLTQENLTKSISTTISQSNNCVHFVRTFVTGGESWIPHVSADNANLACILDENGTQVGCIQVISYTDKDITFQAPLNTGWTIIGYLTVN